MRKLQMRFLNKKNDNYIFMKYIYEQILTKKNYKYNLAIMFSLISFLRSMEILNLTFKNITEISPFFLDKNPNAIISTSLIRKYKSNWDALYIYDYKFWFKKFYEARKFDKNINDFFNGKLLNYDIKVFNFSYSTYLKIYKKYFILALNKLPNYGFGTHYPRYNAPIIFNKKNIKITQLSLGHKKTYTTKKYIKPIISQNELNEFESNSFFKNLYNIN